MKPLLLATLTLLMTTATLLADDCTIDGDDALDVAASNEFRHSVEHSSGTECFRSRDSIIASASSDEAIDCDVTLFGGGTLHPEWSLDKAELLGPVTGFNRNPTGEINFRVGAEAGETGVATLKSVTLSGPDCGNWQQAFAGPSVEPEAEDSEDEQ